jgi:hypothetical protein
MMEKEVMYLGNTITYIQTAASAHAFEFPDVRAWSFPFPSSFHHLGISHAEDLTGRIWGWDEPLPPWHKVLYEHTA